MGRDVSVTEPLRVLAIDDEVPLVQVVGSYLEHEGFAVAIAIHCVALSVALSPRFSVVLGESR
jgi:DNA-binding response OmpR family regulator